MAQSMTLPRPLSLVQVRNHPWLIFHPDRIGAVRERAALAALFAWVPLFVFAVGDQKRFDAFANDWPSHARLLVSIPLFVLIERFIERRLGRVPQVLVASGIVPDSEKPGLERVHAMIAGLRDSWLAPAGLVLLAFSLSVFGDRSRIGLPHGSAAYFWYVGVSSPIFLYLLLRWIWRTVLWGIFVVGVSRLRLKLVATHPDRRCGLGFFSECLSSFAWLAFAIGIPVAVVARGVMGPPTTDSIANHLLPLGIVAGGVVLLVFGPLVAFIPAMIAARRFGGLSFSALTAQQARKFEHTWFGHGDDDKVLVAPDFSSVVDLQDTFRGAAQAKWFPILLRPVLVVAMGALLADVPILMMDRLFLDTVMKVMSVLR